MVGRKEEARELEAEASALLKNILPLYSEGEGFWRSRFPNGDLVDVRHCYDFFTVMNTIGDDLTGLQKREMVEFFKREFYSPTWMHALACGDDDVMFSVRPDHQWNGAYPAWPPQAVLALYRAGEAQFAFDWLKGLSRSANQGPFGQAHFVDSIIAPEEGGARKAPIDFPSSIFMVMGKNIKLTGRVPLWTNLLENVVSKKPWFGYGLETVWYFPEFQKWAAISSGWGTRIVVINGHNGYMDILIYLGVFGLILLCLFLGQGLAGAARRALDSRTWLDFSPLLIFIYILVANLAIDFMVEFESFHWIILVVLLFLPPGRLADKEITAIRND